MISSKSTPLHPRRLNGGVCIILSTLFFSLMGTCVKWAHQIPSHELVFIRSLIVFVIAFFFLYSKKVPLLGNDRQKLLIRGATGAISIFIYFFTIQKIPFAVAITLQYLSPLFTVLIAGAVLKERITWSQWGAVFGALMAVVLIQSQPLDTLQMTSLSPHYLLMGVLGAFLAAASYANIRYLNKSEHPLVIVLYLAVVTICIGAPYTLIHWVSLNKQDFIVVVAMGLFSYLGQYFLTLGYQRDKASQMAILTYLNVVWAVLLGEFFWHEHLSLMGFFGVFAIIFFAFLSQIKA